MQGYRKTGNEMWKNHRTPVHKMFIGYTSFNLVEVTVQYLKPAQLCTELHYSQLCNVDIFSTHQRPTLRLFEGWVPLSTG